MLLKRSTFIRSGGFARGKALLCLSFGVLAAVQLALWPSLDMALWGLLSLSALAIYAAIINQSVIRQFPVSSVMLTGYFAYYFLFPGVATLIEGKSVLNNLVNPGATFVHVFIGFVSIVTGFFFYRASGFIVACRSFLSERIYKPSGLYRRPAPPTLFLIGLSGIAAIGLNTAVGSADAGIGARVLEGMYPLTFMPYCVFLFAAQDSDYKISGKLRLGVVIYTILVLLTALLRNSRSAFFLGLSSVALAYIYCVLAGFASKPRFSRARLLLGLVAAICLAGPLTELAISMTVARASKSELSALALATETVRVYRSGDAAGIAKLLFETPSAWDESYVDNVFFARIANVKFTDKALELVEGMSSDQKERVRDIEISRILALLPNPVLSILGVRVDKEYVMGGSGGDFLFAAATGDGYAVGAFRTGSVLASLYVCFGLFYPFILIAVSFLLFPAADALTRSNILGSLSLSPILITSFFSWFFIFTSAATGAESLSTLLQFLVRGWLQQFLIYGIVLGIATWIVRMLGIGEVRR